ncbi:MAG: Asp-tRNA(Asn)/Glu-tRNA(Gln) amidotransferase subunit GatC [Armatimonadota bacterium]|nr:Asp-tRNA(Asn)/Glu-tRNA(Gln) amidotransferase subunit GatC [Armatimonadota bacterium]
MAIDDHTVEYVAKLSRLELTREERELFREQLSRILEYFSKLNELDTTGIPPTSHAIPMRNVFREDAVTPSLEREVVLDEAPDQEEGYFKVPRVFEE